MFSGDVFFSYFWKLWKKGIEADRLLLVGVNYDRETKIHSCRIEKPEALDK